MLDLSKIIKDEYLDYFCSSVYKEDEKVLANFFTAVSSVSESFSEDTTPPTEIVKSIKSKFSIQANVLDAIVEITNNGLLTSLNSLELFGMLWYVSCRNVMTYDESVYKSMAKQGVIGKLLAELKSRK
jgi:hypothetical protein